ncbi:MAG: hypothetical protein U5L96_01095 [Owenweeksia sp.]|nr:hypothetical protein [Owenweeksia sp.]
MLAKLFNDISVGSLVRAIGLATVLCIVAQFLKVIPAPHLRVAHWHIEVAPWLFNTAVVVLIVTCSVAVSFGLNRLEVLRKDYHLIPVLTIGLLPPMLSNGDLGLVLLLPLVVAPDNAHLVAGSGKALWLCAF